MTIRNILPAILVFHLIIIALSNYLVQIPLMIFGWHSTWAMWTFPMIFLATDLTVRLYGASSARKIIFTAMIPGLILTYVVSVLFYNGTFQGWGGLSELNTFVLRIAFASLTAYAVGQLLDILIFNKLRNLSTWWPAPTASSIIGTLVDTFVFFFLAFYQSSDDFMAVNWPEIATVDYIFKLLVAVVLFVPAYGVLLNKLQARLSTH